MPAELHDAPELHAGVPAALRKRLHAARSACPERKSGGLAFTRPKTKKSRNEVPIPPPFIPYLLEHKAQQDEARRAAAELWQEHDAVFTRPDSRSRSTPGRTGRSSRSYSKRRVSVTGASTTGAATPRARS